VEVRASARLNDVRAMHVTQCMMIVRRIATGTLIGLIPYGAFCQSSFATAPPAFETSSIKPNKTGGARGAIQMKPEGVSGSNVTLKQLLRYAYELQESQLSGPDWIGTESYDVVGKPASPAGAAQLRLMLQRLLEDRFKMKSHRETKELPVYWLVVAEGGPKLRDPKEEEAFNAAFAGKSPFRSGFAGMFTNKDLPGFAERLSRMIGRSVIDKTGIKGRFWFQLEWVAEKEERGTAGPSLLAAVQEQAGLRLVEGKAPTEVLVIDAVERP
jgi:uncharacterized protein (TIGR03435 family)